MTNEPAAVPDALYTPNWAWLRTTVRKRIETDGNAATVVIDTDELTPGESRVFRWLFKMPATRRGAVKVRLSRLDRELAEHVTNGVDLRTTLTLLGGPLDDQRARGRRRKENRIARDRENYDEVVRLVATVPELEEEYTALVETPPSPTLRVPSSSRSGTQTWSVYELALRAAVVWWTEHHNGRRMSAKELAGKAWRDTHMDWTLPRRFALGNLVHSSFDAAVDEADTELRMRGPLTWISGDTIADASASTPWIGLPALGLRTLGYKRFTARGILLVENSEAFEKVCGMPEIVDSWLCIWGRGFASEGLVRFLRPLSVPIAAWQDLDVDGIRIINNLTDRLGRNVSAIGMSVTLWENGVKRAQTAEQLSRARGLAAELAVDGPIQFRELAARIAKSGDGCEHETLYNEVLPTLGLDLKALEG